MSEDTQELDTDQAADTAGGVLEPAQTSAESAGTAPAEKAPAEVLIKADSATEATAEQLKEDVEKGFWPENWRAKSAGEDKNLLKQLEQFNSPEDMMKAYVDLRKQLSSGEYTRKLPKDADEKQIAKWRKDNGLPEKPEAYDIKLSGGMQPGEPDLPILEEFKKTAFASNMTPTQLNALVDQYYKIQDQNNIARQEQDNDFAETSREVLRETWGADYRRNVNMVNNFISTAPEDLQNDLLTARLANGNIAGNDPRFVKWMAWVSREVNPAATLVPTGTGDTAKAVNERMDEIRGLMADPKSAYYEGATASSLQNEFAELLSASQKLSKRA